MRSNGVLLTVFASLCLAAAGSAQENPGPVASSAALAAGTVRAEPGHRVSLADCLALARKNSTREKVATSAIDAAMARQGQARSARFPEISAGLTLTRLDQDPNFIFPASTMAVPAATMQVAPMTMMLPAGAFGPGMPPVNLPLTIPGSTVSVPAQVMAIPAHDVKLMDATLLSATLKGLYPLYTGGLVGARINQAKAGVAAARHEQRRIGLELTYDVTRAYYAVVLARQVLALARDTLARMEGTLQLTESLYKNGAGRVKKTDYLRNKSMVETIRSMVAQMASQEQVALAGLETAVEWTGPGPLDVADREIPVVGAAAGIDAALARATETNPDIARLSAAIAAARAGVDAAKSGHLPKIGLFGSATGLGNGYDAGMMTNRNKLTLAVGLGVELPIFQGYRVSHAVAEAKADLAAREQQMALLREGVALDIRRAGYHLQQAEQQRRATQEAYTAAAENRDLNERAYQEELVDTKDVIEAQLMEALLAGQHYKTLYDAVEARARLDLVVGQGAEATK